jgi:hypothetical protein
MVEKKLYDPENGDYDGIRTVLTPELNRHMFLYLFEIYSCSFRRK